MSTPESSKKAKRPESQSAAADNNRDSQSADASDGRSREAPKADSNHDPTPDPRVSPKSPDWIAEASHELRLPIANIKLLVETLLDGALDDPQTARRMLSRAKTEVDRLQSLVVNLLSIETVSQERQLKREWVDLTAIVRTSVETVSKLAQEKSIVVESQIEPAFKVFANASQIDQVILNLLENAIKFTPAGGRVIVQSGPSKGSFSVIDNGIGIPAHEIPKIFQRFYRVDRAQSRGSTGLGLAIVKHIVDLHGAKIIVTSKEGAGSSFSLEFPGPPDAAKEMR